MPKMVLRFRLVTRRSASHHWTREEEPATEWKTEYKPPWLMLFHILEVCTLLIIYFSIMLPSIKNSFLAQNVFKGELCPEQEYHQPYDDINDILEFIENFNDNLEKLMFRSFLQLYFVDNYNPFNYMVKWNNGTVGYYDSLSVTLELFQHIKEFQLYTDIYSVSPKSDVPGCTQWHVSAVITLCDGSYAFTAAPHIVRNTCPISFLETVTEKTPPNQSIYQQVNTPEINTFKGNLKRARKTDIQKTKRKIATSLPKRQGPYRNSLSAADFKLRASEFRDHPNRKKLPQERIWQAKILERFSIVLMLMSFGGLVMLGLSIFNRVSSHNNWHKNDSAYKDLDLYSQVHLSIGFWHPLHLITEIAVFGCSIQLAHESQAMTQYVSERSLMFFAFAFFFSMIAACRWFIYFPKLYQLIRIIRVSFKQIIEIIIGLTPFVCSLMFFGSFMFGFVSDISKSFMRFLQMFVGVTFGDDLFFMFTYYTDGSDLFTTMAFFYVTIVTILAGYICFPAFTATISFLHKTEVIPQEEREAENAAENS